VSWSGGLSRSGTGENSGHGVHFPSGTCSIFGHYIHFSSVKRRLSGTRAVSLAPKNDPVLDTGRFSRLKYDPVLDTGRIHLALKRPFLESGDEETFQGAPFYHFLSHRQRSEIWNAIRGRRHAFFKKSGDSRGFPCVFGHRSSDAP